MNLDLSSVKNVLGLLAIPLGVLGMIDMLPTGFDIPVSSLSLIASGIFCAIVSKA